MEIGRLTGIKTTLARYRRTLTTIEKADDFTPTTFRALCERIEITPSGKASVVFKDSTTITTN